MPIAIVNQDSALKYIENLGIISPNPSSVNKLEEQWRNENRDLEQK